jgi:hypothetical protein
MFVNYPQNVLRSRSGPLQTGAPCETHPAQLALACDRVPSSATRVAEHESVPERDFVTLSSFADARAVVTAQPVTIPFEHEGQKRRYTPDFRVDWSDDRRDIVEIKYRADLRAAWSQLRPAFEAAREWAYAMDARFRIATERGIRGLQLDTAKRLLPLRNVPVDTALAECAVALARDQERTFATMVASLPAPRDAALAVIWRLIARGALVVDLSVPIVAHTRILAPSRHLTYPPWVRPAGMRRAAACRLSGRISLASNQNRRTALHWTCKTD